MEEQIDILELYLKIYDEKNYKDTFYNFTYSAIIQHFIDYKIYEYNEYGQLPNEDEIISRYKKEISTITNLERKKKVLPLILFIGEDFYQELFKIGFFNELQEFLLKELKEINFDINLTTLDEDSYQFENQSNLKKEIENFDFNTILGFNFNLPNMGNNQYVRFLYFIAEKLFFEEYCRVLKNKNSFNFLCLTNFLESDYFNSKYTRDKKRRIKLLEHITEKNKLILEIRFLRDLLWHEYDRILVKSIIIELSKDVSIWKSFCEYYLNNISQYKKLFQPLGELINDFQKEKIDIFIASIKIDKYSRDDNIKALNDCLLQDKNKYILEKIFQKWLDFIDNYDDYFSLIILTDFRDILIEYVTNYLEKNKIEEELKKCIYNIEEINNKWFKSNIEQNNYFYKNMTKLFLYGVAIKKYDLQDIKSDIKDICTKSFLLDIECKYGNKKTTLELFETYII
jgi:hypothetical protein